jgi:hypothetical protein
MKKMDGYIWPPMGQAFGLDPAGANGEEFHRPSTQNSENLAGDARHLSNGA